MSLIRNTLKNSRLAQLTNYDIFNRKLYTTVYFSLKLKNNNQGIPTINSHQKLNYHSIKKINFSSWQNKNNKTNLNLLFLASISIGGAIFYYLYGFKSILFAKENTDEELKKDLPYYDEDQIKEHNSKEKRIWVSFKTGVYDITDFVENHPGGDKILLAAGGSLEPFWEIYTVHKSDEVFKMLEEYRIGNLKESSQTKKPATDAYKNDPKRHPLLKVVSEKPFNAETPSKLASESLITPNELHFVRNHLPVPNIKIDEYELEIINESNGQRVKLTLNDLRNCFPVYNIPVTIMCAGNRRMDMNSTKQVMGLMWGQNAISTAEWTGVKLIDVLEYYKIDYKDETIKHVQFEGLDQDISGANYGASIPKEKAISGNGDVLIAFEMNGKEIPLDHGYPVRIIVPGIIGARSVKWLKTISLSSEESKSLWQQKDYKLLSPQISNLQEADFSKVRPIQESPVQSAICEPVNGALIEKKNKHFFVKGYAFSGGGNAIDSVLVSIDDGNTWKQANLQKLDQPLYKAWAWTLFEVQFDIPDDKDEIKILCVATDSFENTQPETAKSIWNLRGLLNNSWHNVKVKVA